MPTRFSNSPCRARRPRSHRRRLLGSLVAAVCLGGGPSASAASTSNWSPWLQLGAGHESDLILEQAQGRVVVPGGSLVDLAGGFRWTNDTTQGLRLAFSERLSLERFVNDSGRLLFADAASLDLRGRLGGFAARLSAGGNYFDDSERPTARRLGGGLEAAIGLAGRRGLIEARAGIEGRRYPSLQTLDAAGRLGDYTESGWSAGAAATLRPVTALFLSAEATRRDIDTRDPWYDAASWTLRGSAWIRLAGGTWLSSLALYQVRDFDLRPDNEDRDVYLQLGTGLEQDLGPELALSLRYAFSRYERTDGDAEDSHRVTASLTWRPGRGDRAAAAPETDGPPPPRAGAPLLFRLHAPGAARVSLVGSFNGWDPARDPLRPESGGWWRLERPLPAGTHAYAYLVDGAAVTPPEAAAWTDDGFGGRNGLITILPPAP